MEKIKLPERFVIPADRIPRPWSQGFYDCCVAASITKVLEVINYVKTGKYVMFSKGYVYGRHNRPTKTKGGMDYQYTLNSLLTKGTVPEEMCSIMDEMPDIMHKLEALPNIAELDREAEKTKIKSFTKVKGGAELHDNVKRILFEKQMPLVGNMVGKRHCTVICGWDGQYLLFHDHKGREATPDDLCRGRFNEVYYLEGDYEVKEFKDVKEDHWAKEYIDKVVKEGDMKGISEDEFNPDGYATRGQLAALICRLKYGME